MPRKKKSKASERKKVPPVASNGSLDVMKTSDKPDEETFKKIKDKVLNENPEYTQLLQYWENMSQDRTEHAQDSYAVFANKRGIVTQELLLQYPNSPTARDTMKALNHYQIAFGVLWSYPKQRAQLQSDCDILQPGFHHFIEGYMMAQYMRQQFPLPKSFTDLVDDYLQLRPNDILVEYIRVKYVIDKKTMELPDYERCKETIRALEMFVHKLLRLKNKDPAKRILIDAYYVLAARYTTTDQYVRALDVIEKCYALDETNIAALYMIAFHYMEKDPKKALKLCNKYLDMAPKCDEKFPNAHYIIGYVYACHFHNIGLAKKYYYLGVEAETYRLPFNPPTELDAKSFLESLIPLAASCKGKLLQKPLEYVET